LVEHVCRHGEHIQAAEQCGAEMTEERTSHVEFLWQVHSYTNEYIRFADTKAALTVAWATALLGVLYAERVHAVADRGIGYLAITLMAAAPLCAGFVLAVWSILPRLFRNPIATFWVKRTKENATESAGLIYWGDVLSLNDSAAYQSHIERLNEASVVAQLSRHIFVLSGVARSKYRLVNLSIAVVAIGSVFSVWALVTKP